MSPGSVARTCRGLSRAQTAKKTSMPCRGVDEAASWLKIKVEETHFWDTGIQGESEKIQHPKIPKKKIQRSQNTKGPKIKKSQNPKHPKEQSPIDPTIPKSPNPKNSKFSKSEKRKLAESYSVQNLKIQKPQIHKSQNSENLKTPRSQNHKTSKCRETQNPKTGGRG